jgi:hypothetical protein
MTFMILAAQTGSRSIRDTLTSMANLASTWTQAEELEVQVMELEVQVMELAMPLLSAITLSKFSSFRSVSIWSFSVPL